MEKKKLYTNEDLEHIDLLRNKTLQLRKLVALHMVYENSLVNGFHPEEELPQIRKRLDNVFGSIQLLEWEIKQIILTHFL
jgi:hypothetical protein